MAVLHYVKISKIARKFDERGIRAFLVGYTTTGYLLWHPNLKCLLESRHVHFNKKLVYGNLYGPQEKIQELDTSSKNYKEDLDWLKKFKDENEQDNISDVEVTDEPKKRGRP